MAVVVNREPDAYPKTGTLTFEDYSDNILRTIEKILDGRRVRLLVEWTEIEEDSESTDETLEGWED